MTDPNDDTPPLGSVDAEPLEAKSRAPEPEGTESAASIAAGERSGPARDPGPASEQISAPQTTSPAAVRTPPPAAVPMLVGRRQFARTTPVVVDRGRASFGLPSIGDRRQAGQVGLVILMIAALGAILLARGGTPPTSGIVGGGGPSPAGSISASPATTPQPSPSVANSPAPSASAPARTPKPSPTVKPKTYVVKSGDTLSGIAARNHTTVRAIIKLNGLKSPYVIHPGQVLKLPS